MAHAKPANLSWSKRAFRTAMRILPATQLSYNVGKLFTRTWLTPEPSSTPVSVAFARCADLALDIGEFVCNDLYCLDAHFESTTMRLWRELAGGAATILDLGSHVGTYAIMASTINSAARIVAVEPCRRNLPLLYQNTSTHPNIQVWPHAIGCHTGRGTFQVATQAGGGYLTGAAARQCVRDAAAPDTTFYSVDVITLTQLCDDVGFRTVDLMKMDIEGAELDLLTGEEEFWTQRKPRHIIVEIGLPKAEKFKLDTLLHRMLHRGYSYRKCQNLYAVPWKESRYLANWHFWLSQ